MDKIRELMIESIVEEWKAFLQYSIHASMMQSMDKSERVDHLLEHADEERDHANRLTIHMLTRGEAFDIDIACDCPREQVAGDTLHMLAADLQDEIDAIERYVKIVEIIGDDPRLQDTKILIEDIITNEIEHQDDLAMTIMYKMKYKIEKANPEEIAIKHASLEDFVKCANKLDNIGMTREASRIDNFLQDLIS